MLDLTVTEELSLPVSIKRAREACERAITQLDWIIREQSPTALLAREKGLFGMDWLGTKTLTAPADLSLFLSESDNGTRVRLNATHSSQSLEISGSMLVSGAEMPAADALPESLRKLAMRNATRVRPNPDFRPDMTRLIEGLEELFAQNR